MHSSREEIVLVLVGGTAIVLFLACVLVIYIIIFQKRQNRFLNEKEMLKMNYERLILQTQLEIKEDTLKNISQEIHDNIGQTLSLAKLNLNTINLDHLKVSEKKIENSKELVSKAIQDLRSLSRTLNTDNILASGLLRAIEYEVEQINKTGEFKTELIVNGETSKIDEQKELILFRVVQEAIANIIKHSNASTIKIVAAFSNNLLILSIKDDGKGFDAFQNLQSSPAGIGLMNMKSRAELIGGLFEIESSSITGTKIQITVPLV